MFIIQRITKDAKLMELYYPTHFGTVNKQQSYSGLHHFTVPSIWPSGEYVIGVTANFNRRLFENEEYENNDMSRSITVEQLVPDLEVGDVDFILPKSPAKRFNSEGDPFIQVNNITVKNVGKIGVANESRWRDTLFVQCVESRFNAKIGELQWSSKSLDIGLTYTFIGFNTTIKRQKPTDCHLVFQSDSDDNIVESNKLNNRRQSNTFPLPVAVDDLEINLGSIYDPDKESNIRRGFSIYAGRSYTIDVTYTARQYPTSGNFEDRLELHLDQKIYMLNTLHIPVIKASATHRMSVSFDLPNDIFGSGMLVLKHDISDKLIRAEEEESGQRIFKREISIEYPPTTDLVPSKISFKLVKSEEKRKLTLEWEVTNEGNTMEKPATWTDSLYLVDANSGRLTFLSSSTTSSIALASGQSYSSTKDIYLANTLQGRYGVRVDVDSRNNVFEGLNNGELNNEISAGGIDEDDVVLRKPNLPDLVVDILPATTTLGSQINAGEEFYLSFRFLNNGTADLKRSSLFYTVYLRGTYQDLDFLLYSNVIYESINVGSAITKTLKFTIPITAPAGAYTVQVTLDKNERINEQTKSNNAASTPSFQIKDVPSSKIDLQPDISNITIVGGEPIKIPYTFINRGPGNMSVLTPSYVTLILSTDQVVDPFDIRMCGVPVVVNIKVNETHRGVIECDLPFDLPLEIYFLILHISGRTVSPNDDNQFKNIVTMENKIQQLKTDLAVVSVNLDSRVVLFGGNLKTSWSVLNNGSATIDRVYQCDTVYLSLDQSWDINDKEVDKKCNMLTNIKAGDITRNTIDTKVPLVRQAPFHSIVKTRSSLLELNTINNIGVSNGTVLVQHQNLTLGVQQTVSVGRNGMVLRIPNVSPGNSLMVTAEANNPSNFLELFVNSGDIATAIDYIARSGQQANAKQSVSVPNTRKLDYYVFVRNSLADQPIPNVKILAKIAIFEITSVFPMRIPALRGEQITLQIEGSLFPPLCLVRLKNTQVHRPQINANEVYRFSSTKLFATFSLDAESVQLDDQFYLEIKDGEDVSQIVSTKSVDPLTVFDGSAGAVVIHASHPRGVRVNENLDVEVVVKNEGDTDVLPPLLYLNVTGEVRIKIIREQRFVNSGGNLLFLAASFDQPSGILLPKHVAKFDFEIIPKERERASLPLYIQRFDDAADDIPHPYVNLKEAFRPSYMSDRRWEPVWNQFLANVGRTVKSFHRRICKTASHFSMIKRPTIDIDELVRYEIALADGLYLSNNLHTDVDLSLEDDNVDTFLPISMRRYANPLLSFRDLPGKYNGYGPFGKQWIPPFYWYVSLLFIILGFIFPNREVDSTTQSVFC